MLPGPDAAQLVLLSSDAQRLTLRVRDVNDLPYPGVRVQASGVEGTALVETSNSDGQVSFNWAAGQTLAAKVEGASGASVFVNTSSDAPLDGNPAPLAFVPLPPWATAVTTHEQPPSLTIDGAESNVVKIGVR